MVLGLMIGAFEKPQDRQIITQLVTSPRLITTLPGPTLSSLVLTQPLEVVDPVGIRGFPLFHKLHAQTLSWQLRLVA